MTPLAYWEERAERYGARAAINLDHPAGSLEAVSEGHRSLLLPLLESRLHGDERTILDLGCGPGRMTGALAALIGGRAIGVDPVAAMLALAPAAAGAEYRLMPEGAIPLVDGAVDVAFTCLVLGGLEGAVLDRTLSDLRRVLAPGGLVFICESVSEVASAGHWAFRTTAEYASLFDWVPLEVVSRFDDGGDPVAVLAGRRG